VYNNVALNRTRTGDHPLFMGPILYTAILTTKPTTKSSGICLGS